MLPESTQELTVFHEPRVAAIEGEAEMRVGQTM